MKRELIEDFLLSELAEVKGGQASKDCHCSSGAAETIIVVPIEEIEKLWYADSTKQFALYWKICKL